MRNRLEFLLFAGHVRRFHSVPTIRDNTVGHHSWGVAQLCWLLTEGKCSANLLYYALNHDVAELVVGDVPAPTKRSAPGLKEAMDRLEDQVLTENGITLPDLTPDEFNTFKLADYMDGMMNCIFEKNLGNRGVIAAFNTYANYIRGHLQAFEHEGVAREVYEAIINLSINVGLR